VSTKTNHTPAAALAAAVATRDERGTALDDARAAVERIVSQWRAGIDTSPAAEKRSAEDEIERLTLLHAAAERDVKRARRNLPGQASPSLGARDLVGAVARAVADATSYTSDVPTGPMDNGRRFGLATYPEGVQTSVATDRDGQRTVTVNATFVGHPTLRNGNWKLSHVEPEITKALAAQVGALVPGLGTIEVADALGSEVRENAGAARDRDGVHVVGGRSERSMVDALAVRVRFVAVTRDDEPVVAETKPTKGKATGTAVDPRERKVTHPGEVSQ
jgi:hypothetical protein